MANATFQKIDESNTATLGPSAVLVCGFGADIEQSLKGVLAGSGAPEHRIIFCTRNMVKQPLRQALVATTPDAPAEPESLPRAMVLSGMNGAQLQAFLSGYRSSKLPRPIFASVTPVNLGFPVGRLLVELLREQRELARR